MWTLGALANSLVLFVLWLLAGWAWERVPVGLWWGLGLGAALLSYSLLMPQWRYAVHRWEVTDTAVYTQTGWWRRERRIAPMSRIQTVDYVEGAISRLFRLASVTATTASAAGALEIAGLDRDRARSLVDELTLKADAIPGDAT
jgi:membrane protein YdbS with pleckstrin-like domain